MGILDQFKDRVQQSFSRGDSAAVSAPVSPIES
ncbi:hypothetical protein LCGC14_1011140, partial [marine sediment metagenome]